MISPKAPGGGGIPCSRPAASADGVGDPGQGDPGLLAGGDGRERDEHAIGTRVPEPPDEAPVDATGRPTVPVALGAADDGGDLDRRRIPAGVGGELVQPT